MFLRLLALFLILPFVELAILLWMAAHVGWLPTLGLVVLTAIVGAAEVRREGLRAWVRFQQQLSRGELPTDAMFDGLLILIAGALLLTPGIITDLIGFSLLLSPSRNVIKNWVRRWIERRMVVTFGDVPAGAGFWRSATEYPPRRGRPDFHEDVIDVEYHRLS